MTKKLLLILAGIAATLVILEVGMRIAGFAFVFSQELRNRQAMKQKGACTIMCVGESTSVDYPVILQQVLDQSGRGIRFRVINKARPAISTGDIVERLPGDLEQYKPDLVIVMMGVNDGTPYKPYPDASLSPVARFFRSLRVYKLVNLLRLHACAKASVKSSLSPPSDVDERLSRVIDLYKRRKRHDQVVLLLKKWIKEDPGYSGLYTQLAWVYMDQRKFTKAEEVLVRAIRIRAEDANTYYTLGMLYCCQRKFFPAVEPFRKAVALDPRSAKACGALARVYEELGQDAEVQEWRDRADRIRRENYAPYTARQYLRLKQILDSKGVKLVCVQYPMLSVSSLKKFFSDQAGILFVDNEKAFRNAVEQEGYHTYFEDNFAGEFGHCTPKGDRLLAENIARAVLKEHFAVK